VRLPNSSDGRATRIPVIPDLGTRCLRTARNSTESRATTLIEYSPAHVWSLTFPSDTRTPRVIVILDPQTVQVRGYVGPGD
jgi:hypothetical protein